MRTVFLADSGHSSGRPTDIVTNGRVGKYNRNETAKPMWIQMQGVEEETKRERRIRVSIRILKSLLYTPSKWAGFYYITTSR